MGTPVNIAAKSVRLPEDIVTDVAFWEIDSPVVKDVGEVAAWKRAPAEFCVP